MKIVFFLLLFAPSLFAQDHTFVFDDASKYFDIKVKLENCPPMEECSGPATFSFYKKTATRPYQVIRLPQTISRGWGAPSANVTMLYDQQSMVNIGDFNFDGMEDIAICNGSNGSYHMTSYNIYLSSRKAKKFVYSKTFTRLAHHLGMFTVDKEKKEIETFDKSGCCYHITERYKVVNNRPVKVYVFEEDATRIPVNGDQRIYLTTKRLVRGRWKTTIKAPFWRDYQQQPN